MTSTLIPHIDTLLADILQSKKIINVKEKCLTAPGENYGSLMLSVKVTLQSEDNVEEDVYLVAKLLPQNQLMRKLLNVEYTFRNELGFYETILPTLKKYCLMDTDCYPKFHGGRMGLTSGKLDEHATILMENLKMNGYLLLDKNQGLDLDTTNIILEKLAQLHGSVIGLKENHEKIFQQKLVPFFGEYDIFSTDEEADSENSEIVSNAVIDVLKNDTFCSSYIDRVQEAIQISSENLKLPRNSPKFQKDVFSTIIHNDLWVNNILAKIKEDKVVDLKIFDWQLYEYASATKDILFFLCSSVTEKTFDENFDQLVSFYYDNLLDVLKKLKCDVKSYSFEVFNEEMKKSAREISYFFMMTQIPSIFPPEEHVTEISELDMEKLLAQFNFSDICRRRICLITKKFIQKEWL